VRVRQARVDLVRCRLTSQDHSWNWALVFRPFRGGWNFTWWYERVLCTLRLWLTRRISHRWTNHPTVSICGLSRRPASGFSFRPARSDEGSRGEEGHTACQEPWAADNDRIHWVMQHIGAMLANP
jgi:hypothetical protein